MQYLCLIYQDDRALAALPASEYDALHAETLAFLEETRRSGHYLASHALEPVELATSIRVRDDRLAISDGPIAQAPEQLNGYLLIEARDLNEAIRVAARMPAARLGGIEIRPVRPLATQAAVQIGGYWTNRAS